FQSDLSLRIVASRFTASSKNLFKMTGDIPAVKIELLEKTAVVRRPHASCNQRLILGILGQVLGLLIIQILQTMFEFAQKTVSFDQLFDSLPRKRLFLFEA